MSSTFFSKDNGDVILRAGPGPDSKQDFRVHKLVLSLASPVFEDLFKTAQPDQPDGGQEGLPIIPVTDPPECVDLLLRFIYPGVAPPIITDLAVLSALLIIADKYNVQTISPIVKEMLAGKEFLKRDPFGVYIIARRWGFADEAKTAAREVTLAKINNSPSSRDPQNLAGDDFLRLLWFMQKRGDEAKKVIRTHLVEWTDEPDSGVMSCGQHVGAESREFFDALAEKIVQKFDVNPSLGPGDVVMILGGAPDPPNTGFCGIELNPEHDFNIYCPLQPSNMVVTLQHLSRRLGTICEEYLRKAFDGRFPL